MKILSTRWIGGRIGVVCYENEMQKRSVTIAPVEGFNAEYDKQYVAEWGNRLEFDIAKAFFPKLITEENFKFK